MTVENIGNIGDAYSNGKLPKCGMIISATREELMEISGNLLYQEVAVTAGRSIESIKRAAELADKFYDQVCRCKEICDQLKVDPTRQYSHDEVLAIIDELLDGVKPKKGKVVRCLDGIEVGEVVSIGRRKSVPRRKETTSDR